MRILIGIANYGEHQNSHLEKVLAEFLTNFQDHQLSILVDSTSPIPVVHSSITNRIFDPNVKTSLTFKHRPYFRDRLNDFDLFIYLENDILLTRETFNAWWKHELDLEQHNPLLSAGLFRYEIWDAHPSEKYLIDAHWNWHPGHQKIKELFYLMGKKHFRMFNNHQGCYLLRPHKLKHCLESGQFRMDWDYLEAAASEPYWVCGIDKVYPLEDLDYLVVKHLSNRFMSEPHISQNPVWRDPAPLTLKMIQEHVWNTQ